MSLRLSSLPATIVALGAVLVLSACGGGGGSAGDVYPNDPPPVSQTNGPNAFLLFPNPLVAADGSWETNTLAYAQAYYEAIDPNDDKDTLSKWMAANGFGGTLPDGPLGEVEATFGDVRDLGYGRQMRARQNADGTVAVFVHNYGVNAGAGYAYTPLNLEAAVVRDTRWHVGTNAIEFSPGPNGGASFAKFYTFSPSGERLLMANLDGRGNKAMPGICINCHGGRADPLTPPHFASGRRLFPLVANSVSQHRGDTQSRLHMLNLDHLDFWGTPGFRRSDLEPVLKTLNRMVLCTYPLPAPSVHAEDACRPVAGHNEWQAPAATKLKAAYGGDGLPNATFSDTWVPSQWVVNGQTTMYRNTVQSACMTCHIQRGTANQSDISFIDYTDFLQYAPRIKAHVFDRGNMPLAKIVADRFWTTSASTTMGDWLQTLGYTVRSGGTLLQPGRPVADPGPDRTVSTGATPLSAANSLFATSYSWSIVSNPGNAASLVDPNTATPTFTTGANGTYVLQLVASNGSQSSAPASLTLVVNNALAPAPSTIRFSHVKDVLQTPLLCVSCHVPPGNLGGKPPIFYSNFDRNGDGMVDATDDHWFYTEVRGRINFTDVAASPLLRKPSGHHHNGGLQAGFDTSRPPGHPDRASYDLILNWILNGAPE